MNTLTIAHLIFRILKDDPSELAVKWETALVLADEIALDPRRVAALKSSPFVYPR